MTYDTKPLQLGANGRAVAFLQSRLGVASSGVFDAPTDAALRVAQAHSALTVDGVYGPLTNMKLTLRAAADIASMAAALGVESRALQAVVSVETTGAGFYANGLPKILLERHYVYAIATPTQRARLSADVCSQTPGGYVGGVAEWDRFDAVAVVDIGLAIQSCSWGLGQIMGRNWQALGYFTPQGFMKDAAVSEAAQLMQMGQFLRANPHMLTALRARDWTAFAVAYNGPAQQRYDAKLAAAYDQSAA